jgi:AbrB family looped-hinge helix DNA binding protein
MALAVSKLTAKGQISVPAEVQRKLGLGPGSLLEWYEEGDQIVVRRTGLYSFEDVHSALFPDGAPRPRTLHDLTEGRRAYLRKQRARA